MQSVLLRRQTLKIEKRLFSGVSPSAVITNFINGQDTLPVNKDHRSIIKFSPVTGMELYRVPRSQRDDIYHAITAAKQASIEWSRTTLEYRIDLLRRIADALERSSQEFALAETEDMGKPLYLTQKYDIPLSVDNFRFFADAVKHFPTPCHHMETPIKALNYTSYMPIGIAGLITPWNFPLYLLTLKLAPALVMGNTVVAKPSELTPHTALLLARLCHEVGLPNGVFNVVNGFGTEVGVPLVQSHDIRAISFTGDTSTGSQIAATASGHFTKVSLELSGKNPTIVFSDCDFDQAVDLVIKSAFSISGQFCLSGSRLYVEEPIYKKFVDAVVQRASALSVGPPNDSSTKLGPLISHHHLEKVLSYIADAQEEGGKILCGGKSPKLPAPYNRGSFLAPTVITDLPIFCRVTTEEIFGPVLTIHPFKTENEVIEMANAVKFGLSATILTGDLSRALKISNRVKAGLVWVNSWANIDPRIPFGGMKESGTNREGGFKSLEFFSDVKNTCLAFDSAPSPSVAPKIDIKPVATKLTESASPSSSQQQQNVIQVSAAPKPVGAYPHARRENGFLFLSGIGPRDPKTNEIPGGPIRDPKTKQKKEYNIELQTRAVIENIKTILEGCGSSLDKIIDVQCFLVDMDRDFDGFNKVYAEYFKDIQATRTTISISALPTPIAVEFKVIAKDN